MSDLISVIIPVFNVAQYLDICLNSVARQTHENLEIILIDDGSTDDSGKICDIWGEKDNRVRVIHTVNKGVAAARNYAISVAKGDYISRLISWKGSGWVLP
jgi:glycosyltransferase involved in cell wall biosynthesis